MSGPFQANQIISKMMETDHFSKWLGIEVIETGDGFCCLKIQVREEMLNGFGILHGGVTFALADSCFAFASNSRGMLSVSLQASISFPDLAGFGDFLLAKSKEISLTKSSAIYDVEVSNEANGKIIGLFRGIAHRTSKPSLGL